MDVGELIFFLLLKNQKINKKLIVLQLRARSPQPHHAHSMHGNMPGHYSHQAPINQNARKAEPYFCDRNLVQSLVRDAMVTETFGQENVRSSLKKEEKQ